MSAGADQGEGVVVVDGVKEEPVGYDMQFTVVREVACDWWSRCCLSQSVRRSATAWIAVLSLFVS